MLEGFPMDSWEDWQKPYQFGTLVIWPPDEVREVVNSQRERYDPVSQSYCEAHISVTQPLLTWLDNEAWERMGKSLVEFASFEITYGPLNSFLPYPCIWYEVNPQERVLELRNALHRMGYFNLELKHPKDFIPHLTITEGLSGPTVNEDLVDMLQLESRPGVFLCDGLAYIVPDDNFKMRVKCVLPLADMNR
jgi:2'-5' RNA ligase